MCLLVITDFNLFLLVCRALCPTSYRTVASVVAERISLDSMLLSNTHHSLQSRMTARSMLSQMGSLQFAIAADVLRVLSRVPCFLDIEEAHTVSMEVCEYLESRLLYGSRAYLWVRERSNTEDGGTLARANTPTLVETVANEVISMGV